MERKKQNYNNHTRLFPLHHFVITPLSLIFLVGSVLYPVFYELELWKSILLIIAGIILFVLPVVSRIYATKNQDRIIRLELRQRYFEMTGHSFWEKERQLTRGQLIALRFAGDDELERLINEAITEQLSPKTIKQSVQNWNADYWRV